MQEIIERYIAAWNETDPVRRRGLVDSLWAPDGSYTDPFADAPAGRRSTGSSAPCRASSLGWCSGFPALSTRTTTRPGSPGTSSCPVASPS